MESISKIQLRLYAAKRKNGKWQLEMSRMPKRISVIGRTPIGDLSLIHISEPTRP